MRTPDYEIGFIGAQYIPLITYQHPTGDPSESVAGMLQRLGISATVVSDRSQEAGGFFDDLEQRSAARFVVYVIYRPHIGQAEELAIFDCFVGIAGQPAASACLFQRAPGCDLPPAKSASSMNVEFTRTVELGLWLQKRGLKINWNEVMGA